MTEKKSIKATLSGIGASVLSFAGVCCGGGACAATCGPVCAAPVASVLGFSTAGFATWTASLLPLLTALSAVAFTVAYYSIYKTPNAVCCDPASPPGAERPKSNSLSKAGFWLGLLLTVGFYGNAIANNLPVSEEACCEAPLNEDEGPAAACCASKSNSPSCSKK